jgi:hypothetical protein
MDLANSAPDRVPLDFLLKLSVHDEDWYVQAPVNAAQALLRAVEKEPGRLDPWQLREGLLGLKQINDK